MNEQEPTTDPTRRRSTGRRDLAVIALALVAVFCFGATLDLFGRALGRLERSAPIPLDDLLAISVLAVVGLALFAYRRWRFARIEQALRAETERRFQALVEHVPAVTYVWDGADEPGSVPAAYISPQIERLLGHRSDVWQDDPGLWERSLHAEDLQRVLTAWDTAVESGCPFNSEYRIRTSDGHERWVRDEAVPVAEGNRGRPIYQGVMIDITERRTAEERLREAEERYRTLVEQLPVAVYVDAVDDVSTALYISPQYERLTGYSAARRIEDPDLWVKMLHDDDRERVLAESLRTNRTGDSFDVEYRIISADGRTVWLHDQAFLVDGTDGGRAWQGVLTNVTERILAQQSLDRRDRILEAVGHAAEQFLKEGEWSDCLDEVLERLGRAGGAGRAFVYENGVGESGELMTSLRRAWGNAHHPSASEPEQDQRFPFRAGGFARWQEQLGAGQMIHGPVRDYPASERERLETRGIGSCIVAPIFVDDGWWGYIGFDHGDERDWQPAEIDALRVAANTLGAAIGRERAAQELTQAQARYRGLVEQMPAITYLDEYRPGDDALWPNSYISPQVRDILGYSPQEWHDDPNLWSRLVHPEDAERAREADRRHYGSGEPLDIEIRVHAKDGTVRWMRDQAVVIRDPDGTPRWSQGILLDVTARRLAEQQLHETQERYRSLIETIPAATYIDTVDVRSQAIYMSPQVERIYGYTPREWKEQPGLWEEGLHPEDHDRVVAQVDRHNAEGAPYEAEYRFRRRDGRWVWVHDEAVMIVDEQGGPRFSQGVVFDITPQKRYEEQLRDAEERFRAIVEHVPSAIYLDKADATMESLYVSPQIEQMVGIDAREWMADPELWLKLTHPEDRDAVRQSYVRAAAMHEPWRAEYRMLTRDGRTIWVHDETTFLHDADGNPTFMQGVISDITERKLAEQALRESEQREREAAERLRALDEMKNTFLAAVSHELRSPLTSILGLSLTLERTPRMTEADRDDLLSRLSVNARKLDRLLKDLLDIDRLNRGIVEPQYRSTDVGALASRTVESLESLVDRAVIVETEHVVIAADPAKIERIVENLLVNAARHTTADRRIWLRVGPRADGALIAVDDEGPGVPQELRETIFEPFQQGPTTAPHSPGTGIGLSLVGRFAELHGGRAWVQERPGGGASFRVFLPAGPSSGNGSGNGPAALHAAAEAGSV